MDFACRQPFSTWPRRCTSGLCRVPTPTTGAGAVVAGRGLRAGRRLGRRPPTMAAPEPSRSLHLPPASSTRSGSMSSPNQLRKRPRQSGHPAIAHGREAHRGGSPDRAQPLYRRHPDRAWTTVRRRASSSRLVELSVPLLWLPFTERPARAVGPSLRHGHE